MLPDNKHDRYYPGTRIRIKPDAAQKQRERQERSARNYQASRPAPKPIGQRGKRGSRYETFRRQVVIGSGLRHGSACPFCGVPMQSLVTHHRLPRQPFGTLQRDPENVFVACDRPECYGARLDRDACGNRTTLAARLVLILRREGLRRAVWARRACRDCGVPVR